MKNGFIIPKQVKHRQFSRIQYKLKVPNEGEKMVLSVFDLKKLIIMNL